MNRPVIRPLAETDDTITVSRADWDTLQELLEDLEDVQDLKEIDRRVAAGETEEIPWEVAKVLLDGENPVRVWRRHRQMSLRGLAQAAGVQPGYLSEIETGKKPGSFNAMAKIAEALGISLDDLAA